MKVEGSGLSGSTRVECVPDGVHDCDADADGDDDGDDDDNAVEDDGDHGEEDKDEYNMLLMMTMALKMLTIVQTGTSCCISRAVLQGLFLALR